MGEIYSFFRKNLAKKSAQYVFVIKFISYNAVQKIWLPDPNLKLNRTKYATWTTAEGHPTPFFAHNSFTKNHRSTKLS